MTYKIIITILILLYALMFFLYIYPVKITSPAYIENRKLHRYEQLSSYIEKFQQQEGRLPTSFEEIDNKFRNELKHNFLSIAKKNKTEGKIIDCTSEKIVFEIEAIWDNKKNDELVWAKTKGGYVIRFKKQLLETN